LPAHSKFVHSIIAPLLFWFQSEGGVLKVIISEETTAIFSQR